MNAAKWKEVSKSTPTALWQLIGYAALADMLGEEQGQPGRLYRITGRDGEPDVLVQCLTPTSIASADAYTVPAAEYGPLTPVSYDLGNDETSARSGGGGGGSQSPGIQAGLDAATNPGADNPFATLADVLISNYLRPGTSTGQGNIILGPTNNGSDIAGSVNFSTILGGINALINGYGDTNTIIGGDTVRITDSFSCSIVDSVSCTLTNCQYVKLDNCTGLTLADVTGPAHYIDNVLYQPGGGPATPLRDVYAIGSNNAIRAALAAGNNTWVKGDLTAFGTPANQQAACPPAATGQPANVLVGTGNVQGGDTLDAVDSDGDAWRYTYSRRNDGTYGWTRIPKPE